MLRRAAVRGCGATSSRGQPSALLLAWRRPSSAPAAAGGGGLLHQPQQEQQQQLHTAGGGALAAGLHRMMDSDSRAGYCTLRDARSIPGLQQMQQQHDQQHYRRRERPHFEGLRLPTGQWRALLSTAPPSKEDDKAAQASAGAWVFGFGSLGLACVLRARIDHLTPFMRGVTDPWVDGLSG